MMLDCHTHNPSADGIISFQPEKFDPHPGHLYSVGFHPWYATQCCNFSLLEQQLTHPQVVALGEAGLDRLRGSSLAVQMPIFEKQALLAEEYGKPMIIHCVRCYDGLLAIHKKLRPRQPWIIHGYMGKPELAKQLTDKGIYLSFGEKFNAQSVAVVPQELLLVETDESHLPIDQIASRIITSAATISTTSTCTHQTLTTNLLRILGR